MEPFALAAVASALGVAIFALMRLGRVIAAHERIHDVLLRSLAYGRGGTFRPGRIHDSGELSLELPFGTLRMHYLAVPRSSATKRVWAAVEVARVLPSLRLRPEGPLAEMAKELGMQDFEVGHDVFDRRFVVSSEDPGVALGMLEPAVIREVLGLGRGRPGAQIWIEVEPDAKASSSRVVVQCSGWVQDLEALQEHVDAVTRVCEALLGAWDRPWVEVARDRGLAVGKLGQRGVSSLVGVLDDIPLEVRARRGPEGWRTEVSARVDGPRGLQVVHRDLAREADWDAERLSLGNPVLDMLVAARADDPEALCELVADETSPRSWTTQ